MFHLATVADVERIDHESLRILDEIGIRVDDDDLRNKALAAGARPGHAADWIRLPPEMVREYRAMAPAKASYADRRGTLRSMGPGDEPSFWTGAALNYTTGNDSHAITAADLAQFARVADAMPNLFALVGTSVDDVPPPARDFVGFRIMAANTTRHLRPLLFTAAGVRPILDMAQVLLEGTGHATLREWPLLSFGYSCLSPLHWARINSDMWRGSAGLNLPVMLNGEPIAGATSPVTLAAAVALGNAEILGGVVLVQLLDPGRPVVHNLGFAHTIDMRSGACLAGSAECALMAATGARLAAYYHLPSASWMCTDAFIADEQTALEKMLTGLAHMLGGVNVIWGMGSLQSEKAVSPEQLVIDNEIATAVLRFHRGVTVDDDSLAFDVIREAVLSGSHDFLGHEHTFTHFRTELAETRLLARTRRESWLEAGGLPLSRRAANRVRDILAEPAEPILSDAQQTELAAIEARAMKSLAS